MQRSPVHAASKIKNLIDAKRSHSRVDRVPALVAISLIRPLASTFHLASSIPQILAASLAVFQQWSYT